MLRTFNFGIVMDDMSCIDEIEARWNLTLTLISMGPEGILRSQLGVAKNDLFH